MTKGWTTKSFAEVCLSIEDGDWIEKKDQSNNGIRLIQTGNIGLGVYKDKADKAKYISEETFQRLKCLEVVGGDILISRLPEPIGRACIVPNMPTKCITAVDCSILKLGKDVLPQWFIYYTQSSEYFKKTKEECSGTTRDRITRKKLSVITIPFPSIAEQQRIVDILDAEFAKIDALKANAEKNLQNAKDLFQSAMKSMLYEPNGKMYRLQDVCTDFGEYGMSVPSKAFDGIRYLRITDITEWGDLNNECVSADTDVVEERYILKYGDILFARTGATVGKTLVYDPSFGKCSYAGYLIRYRPNRNIVIPRMLYYITHSSQYYDWISSSQKKSTLPNISAKLYNEYQLSLPTIEEQQVIVSRLDALNDRCKALQENYTKTLALCDDLKQALLRKAFNGEL